MTGSGRGSGHWTAGDARPLRSVLAAVDTTVLSRARYWSGGERIVTGGQEGPLSVAVRSGNRVTPRLEMGSGRVSVPVLAVRRVTRSAFSPLASCLFVTTSNYCSCVARSSGRRMARASSLSSGAAL